MKTVFAELRTYLIGWKGYFQLAETPGVMRGLDEWIRHRLRMVIRTRTSGGVGGA